MHAIPKGVKIVSVRMVFRGEDSTGGTGNRAVSAKNTCHAGRQDCRLKGRRWGAIKSSSVGSQRMGNKKRKGGDGNVKKICRSLRASELKGGGNQLLKAEEGGKMFVCIGVGKNRSYRKEPATQVRTLTAFRAADSAGL